MMKALGRHIILELRDCIREWLNDVDYIERVLLEAAKNANASIITYQFRRFQPQGVSGVVIIAESHLSIHTWPEFNYAACDVYTCGEMLKPERAVSYIIEKLGSMNPYVIEIRRGLTDGKVISIPHKILTRTKDLPKLKNKFGEVIS